VQTPRFPYTFEHTAEQQSPLRRQKEPREPHPAGKQAWHGEMPRSSALDESSSLGCTTHGPASLCDLQLE
jgi:hypothetical protein